MAKGPIGKLDVGIKGPGDWAIDFTGPESLGGLGLVAIIAGGLVRVFAKDAPDWLVWLLVGVGVALLVVNVVLRVMGVGFGAKQGDDDDKKVDRKDSSSSG